MHRNAKKRIRAGSLFANYVYAECILFLLPWRCIMFEVVVDKDKCTGCEECVNACPAQVFELEDGKSEPVEMDECLGCETCVEVCPEGAITVTEM
jgi:NAD-dependent dihydropyrimidine dehydrogenase PreA subunit